MPVDELVPPPADPDRRFSARLDAALPEDSAPAGPDRGRRRSGAAGRSSWRPGSGPRVWPPSSSASGPDGHFAFNQPPTPFDAPARVVDLAPANLARLGPAQPARSALTLGVTTIMAAGSVLVVAAGPGKTEALDHLLNGPEDPAWPVTWLRRHPRLTVAVGPEDALTAAEPADFRPSRAVPLEPTEQSRACAPA